MQSKKSALFVATAMVALVGLPSISRAQQGSRPAAATTAGNGGDYGYKFEDDPLSAVAEVSRKDTVARDTWRVQIETLTRLSCTKDAFLLHATLHVREGETEICHREWDHSIPRDLT